MIPAQEKAVQLIDKFTYWNTSQAEREGILSALKVIGEIINLDEVKDVKYWSEVQNEIINYKNNLI